MKKVLALLIAAFTFLAFGSASAATSTYSGDSVESLSSSLVCAEDKDKKKKKKKGDEEEPECD